jgi:hypothetical protein
VCADELSSQPAKSIQAEVDVKISGAQCNLIISRIKPLIRVNSDKKKPLVLHESSQQEKAPKEKLSLVWACTLSVPELTVVLYSLDDLPLYHVSTSLYSVLYSSVHIWIFACVVLLAMQCSLNFNNCLFYLQLAFTLQNPPNHIV